ncbi:MAG: hypothetical protein KTR31_22735 [Myxococcales bacterium]|nr:hypothetical protein [Myxococcales bacterium]
MILSMLCSLAVAGPTPPSLDGSLSGTLDWGNLDQIRGLGRGHLARHGASWGNAGISVSFGHDQDERG